MKKGDCSVQIVKTLIFYFIHDIVPVWNSFKIYIIISGFKIDSRHARGKRSRTFLIYKSKDLFYRCVKKILSYVKLVEGQGHLDSTYKRFIYEIRRSRTAELKLSEPHKSIHSPKFQQYPLWKITNKSHFHLSVLHKT